MSKTVKFDIIGGGSKFELFQQLALIGARDDEGDRIKKSFFVKGMLEGRPAISGRVSEELIKVDGIRAEDGSGNRWLISGYFPNRFHTELYEAPGGHFDGYYDSNTRRGFLNITFI